MIGAVVAVIVILYALFTISRAFLEARRARKEKKE